MRYSMSAWCWCRIRNQISRISHCVKTRLGCLFNGYIENDRLRRCLKPLGCSLRSRQQIRIVRWIQNLALCVVFIVMTLPKSKIEPFNFVAPEPVTNDNLWPITFTGDRPEPSLPLCQDPPPGMVGNITTNLTSPESLDTISSVLRSQPPVTIGGRWRPDNCTSRSRVAVVMSYRNRSRNLKLILQHLHPFLQKQLIEYQMFVVEPEANLTFNRGMLKNIGFMAAMQAGDFTCVVFQDIDLLPEVDLNLYHCHEIPRHLVVSINTKNYEPLAEGAIFGGAVLFRINHFRLVNGYSNLYFDWGAEDDDLLGRVKDSNLNFSRSSNDIGRFVEAVHEKDDKRPIINKLLLEKRQYRQATDGLNSLSYKVLFTKESPSHTWINVYYNETTYRKQIEVATTTLSMFRWLVSMLPFG